MLDILERNFYRPVDRAALSAAEVAAWPSLLDDRYTHFMTASEYERFMTDETATAVGIGIDFDVHSGQPTLTRVFPNSPAAQGGLRRGDVLVSIDGQPFSGHTPLETTMLIKGEAGTVAQFEVRRGSSTFAAHVKRQVASSWMVDSELRRVGGRRVGYIALMDFSEGVGALTRAAVVGLLRDGAESLVLDLRGNPGGWAREAVRVAEVFLPEDSVVLAERSIHFDVTTYSTSASPATSGVPLAVLVDGGTASSAEIVAGALRDHQRAVLIGSTTFGKGRIQDVSVLSTGGALKYTVAEYLTPNGFALDRKGLTPDLAVGADVGSEHDSCFDTAVAQTSR